MPTTLTGQLSALARSAGAARTPVAADRTAPADVLADRPDGTVVGHGAVVAKAHPPGTDAGELAARLRTAAHPRLAGILLPPLDAADALANAPSPAPAFPLRQADGRLATLWPRGTPVSADAPDDAPWEAAGALLARLHRVPVRDVTAQLSAPLPPMGGPAKAARALARMRTALGSGTRPPPAVAGPLRAAADAVERAWAGLPAWCRAQDPPPPSRTGVLCHGDFHLGQLIRFPAPDGPWQLIDVDDLGTGDPAWDLARPAAWYAAGLLPADDWERFLGAYRAGPGATGTPLPDPWPRLDAPARALTVQTAALGIAKAHAAQRALDEAEVACVNACARIAELDGTTLSAAAGQPYEPGP